MSDDAPTPNPDRAQVRDFGRSNPWPAVQAEYERMREEIQRLTDEVAYLTRERDRWRDRALQAEARLAQRVGCGGAA